MQVKFTDSIECADGVERDVLLEADVSPDEPMTRDYPGSPSCVEITRAVFKTTGDPVPDDLYEAYKYDWEERAQMRADDIIERRHAQREAQREDSRGKRGEI
jgi:hypothetical protein